MIILRWRFAFLCLLILLCIFTLQACASGQLAYQEGLKLASTAQSKAALTQFEEAIKQNPESAQYKIAAIQTREILVIDALNAAKKSIATERYDEARTFFQSALLYQPNNTRALDGIDSIIVLSRHAKWLAEAQLAIDKKDSSEGENWLRMVLAEDPKNKKASTLMEAIGLVKQKTSASNSLADAYRKSITIEFKDTPLKTVFEVISRTSGLNFIFDKDVKTDQKTSIFLKNSTIESVVNLTLLTNQLGQRVLSGNTVLIYPDTQVKQKNYQLLVVKTFYLANAEAKAVANTIKTILKTKDIVVDENLNMLIVRDTPDAIRLAAKLVAVHDIAASEVMLEVEILEVKRSRLLDLGIRWPDQISLSPIAASTGSLSLADLKYLNSSTLNATIGSVTINAKKFDTDANILANPRIRVRNREKAKILIGERVPNITSTSTATGFVGESVNYVDVGLKLDVEPTISVDGEVAIKISLEVSSIISQVQTKSGSIAYQIGTRSAQTMLRLKDGENQVLAGLINSEERHTGSKVPGFGDIPIVGRLFGQQNDDNSKTEIVLSITPRILRNLQKPAESILEFDSGTESNLASAALPSPNAFAKAVSVPTTSNDSSVVKNEPPSPAALLNNSLATSAGAILSWQGPSELKVGDTAAVKLVMQSSVPVMNLPLVLGFDAKTVQVVSVIEGDFLKQGAAQTSFTSRIDPSGQLFLTNLRSNETGASAAGVVATVNFKVTAAPVQTAKLAELPLAPQLPAPPSSPQSPHSLSSPQLLELPIFRVMSIAPMTQGGKGIAAPLPSPFAARIAP